jgi:NAD(P)-dependent dehydrogenase (short-subunit alcohol dehydrogenase family)
VKNLVSNLLDTTVVGGFSRIGYEVRSRLNSFEDVTTLDLADRRIVVTGPTSGLGHETCVMLARAGADLVLVGRDEARTVAAAERIDTLGSGEVSFVVCDMGNLGAVNAASRTIASGGAVDALVHNAGALTHERVLTPQGFESTVATHVLGPFLMTSMLVDTVAGVDGRVVTVSSGGMYSADLPRVAGGRTLEMNELQYNGTRQYAIAKRAQVVLNEMWSEKRPDVHFAAMHPGWADTPGVKSSLPTFRTVTRPLLRTPRQGADTIAWLAAADTLPAPSGTFWCDREPRSTHKTATSRATDTPDRRRDLWNWCESVTRPFAA